MNLEFLKNLPLEVYSGAYFGGHVQGIAVDTNKGHVYFSFTTQLVKTDLQGNFIGSVTGLAGHLGCISFCRTDGKIYASLEYKRDHIGQGILKGTGEDFGGDSAFYIAVFNTDKILRADLDAEADGIMEAAYLREVVKDYTEPDEVDGLPHRYGCSGIDGISFGPVFGKSSAMVGEQPNNEEILCVAYGIYGDTERSVNDHQVLLAYDPESVRHTARPLSQHDPHQSGPIYLGKYFLYTGNTTFGIQNLEYNAFHREWLASVYVGTKAEFPNYPLFALDGTVAPKTQPLAGRDGEIGLVLTLKKSGAHDAKSDIYGYTFPKGQTGMFSLGNRYFYISYDGETSDKRFFSQLKLCRRRPDEEAGFEVVCY